MLWNISLSQFFIIIKNAHLELICYSMFQHTFINTCIYTYNHDILHHDCIEQQLEALDISKNRLYI